MSGNHLADLVHDDPDHFLRILGKRNYALSQNLSAQIGDSEGGLTRMDVHGENSTLPIEIEKGWPAAAGKAAHRSLNNPSFCEQFLHNQRNSAPLQPR